MQLCLQRNLTDYSLECPKGSRKFFAFVHFTDETTCLYANIFTFDRKCALMPVLEKFHDCLDYIDGINPDESDY